MSLCIAKSTEARYLEVLILFAFVVVQLPTELHYSLKY